MRISMHARAAPLRWGPEILSLAAALLLSVEAPLLGVGLGFVLLGRSFATSVQRAGGFFGLACLGLGPIVMAQHFFLASGAGPAEAFVRQPALALALCAAVVAILTWAVPKRRAAWLWSGLQVGLAGYLSLSALLPPLSLLTAGAALVAALLALEAVGDTRGSGWLWACALGAFLGGVLLSPPLFNA